MTSYIALIHKEPRSDFGVSFPDFPGCVTAGRTLDEARKMAEEALALHVDGPHVHLALEVELRAREGDRAPPLTGAGLGGELGSLVGTLLEEQSWVGSIVGLDTIVCVVSPVPIPMIAACFASGLYASAIPATMLRGSGSPISTCRCKSLSAPFTGEVWDQPVDGFFLAIGHIPNTKPFVGQLDLDPDGYILTYAEIESA